MKKTLNSTTGSSQDPKLATLKESQSYPGFAVAKYKRNVFYSNLWNRQLEECRGTVFDMEMKKSSFCRSAKSTTTASTPSHRSSDDAEMCQAFRKVNGFMLGAGQLRPESERNRSVHNGFAPTRISAATAGICFLEWAPKRFEGFRSFVRLFPDANPHVRVRPSKRSAHHPGNRWAVLHRFAVPFVGRFDPVPSRNQRQGA